MIPFDEWLAKNKPNVCQACWGEGYMIFNGNYVKNQRVLCPVCCGLKELDETKNGK